MLLVYYVICPSTKYFNKQLYYRVHSQADLDSIITIKIYFLVLFRLF